MCNKCRSDRHGNHTTAVNVANNRLITCDINHFVRHFVSPFNVGNRSWRVGKTGKIDPRQYITSSG